MGEFSTFMQTRDWVEGLHNCHEFSQPLEYFYQAMQTQEKKVFCWYYKITSSKNYNAGKSKKYLFYWSERIFLQHWLDNEISQQTNQNVHFENLVVAQVVACLQLVYLYVTQPCLHTLLKTRLSANQSARSILVIL